MRVAFKKEDENIIHIMNAKDSEIKSLVNPKSGSIYFTTIKTSYISFTKKEVLLIAHDDEFLKFYKTNQFFSKALSSYIRGNVVFTKTLLDYAYYQDDIKEIDLDLDEKDIEEILQDIISDNQIHLRYEE